jgi:putative mRNA 3-end processing factor
MCYMPAVRGRGTGEDDFVWSGGVRIAGTSIGCDAPRVSGLSFVSHAHLPLRRRGKLGQAGASQARVIATARTLALRGALSSEGEGERPGILVAPFSRPFALGRLRLELLPSGHVPGSAQLLVERPGRRLLYAGDVNPLSGRAVEPAQVRGCDALFFDAPLAPLVRALPPREEVEAALILEVRRALDEGKHPLVLAPALGGAGEVAILLEQAKVPFRAHRKIAALLSAYRRFDAPVEVAPARARRFEGSLSPGEALLWPLELSPPALDGARRLHVSGEALDPAFAPAGSAAFPLSDHGDLPSLIGFAKDTGARDVYLLAAQLTDEVARAFRARRLRVHALFAPEQTQLFAPS